MLKHSSTYISTLDGLRGCSILLVFVAHIGFESIIPGGLGVTIFFFISGYIITKLLIDEAESTGSINLKSFAIRRLLRLYPPLLFMIALFFSYLYYHKIRVNPSEVFASIFYYENYFFFTHANTSSDICKTLWSLGVEEHFYIIFPIIFTLLYKSPKGLIATLSLFTIVPLIYRFIGVYQYSYSADVIERYTYTLTHTRFDSIIYGCLASILIYLAKAKNYHKVLINKYSFTVAAFLLLICLIIRNPLFRNTVRYSLQGLSLFVLIPALINTSVYPKIKRLFSQNVLVQIGKMSYSIYLVHMIAISSLIFLKTGGHPLIYYFTVTLLTATLSSFMYFCIEKPLIRYRLKFKPNQPVLTQGEVSETIVYQRKNQLY